MGKKVIATVLTLLLALTAVSAMATSSGVVDLPSNFTGLNVRKGPGTQYEVVAWVLEGDYVTILDWGNTWSKIQIQKNGKSGYIKNAYIDSEDGPSNPEIPSKPQVGSNYSVGRVSAKYASSSVNLRKGPGTDYATVGSARNGVRLKLFATSGNWRYVETSNGLRGYISKNYIAQGAPYTTTARVNFRETPNGALIRTLTPGQTVTVVSVSNGWAQGKVGSTSGYTYLKYLR